MNLFVVDFLRIATGLQETAITLLLFYQVFLTEIFFYDVVAGHFVTRRNNVFYDWSGQYKPAGLLVEWESFHLYDSLQKERIIRDCIL